MQKDEYRRSFRRYSTALLMFGAVLIFLEWGMPALGIPAFVLPAPSRVLGRMLDPENDLLFHFGITALEGVSGFIVGSLAGFVLAVTFVHVRAIEDALYPWAVVLQTVPLVAIAPLLVIWFGNGILARIVMSALFTFFPVLVNTTRGLRRVDRATMDLLQSYAITRWQLFWMLRMPNCLPFLFTGLKIGSTLAIIGAIVAQFAGAGQGLGFVITISTYFLQTDRAFAAITAAAVLGMSMYWLIIGLERWLIFWEELG